VFIIPMNLAGTDASGTPGAATIDKPCGRAAIALGAATVVITNALVKATSLVVLIPMGADATGINLRCAPADIVNGAFTARVDAACTADLPFGFLVFNTN